MQAADFRSQLFYAANTSAELSVTVDEGCDVYYTTDGSDPKTEVVGNTAKIPQGTNTLYISPTSNSKHTVTVKALAFKDGKASTITEKKILFLKIKDNDQGTKVYLGTHNHIGVGGRMYPIKVRVTTIDGKISRVEDNGTVEGITDEADYAFWFGYDVMGKEGMPAQLKDKNLVEVLKMRTVPEKAGFNTDAVSGATVWSDGIRYATIDALESNPVHESDSKILLPVLSTDRLCVPNKQGKTIEIAMEADEGMDIHYTLDGSVPSIDSPVAKGIGVFGEHEGVVLKAAPNQYPNGQIVCVRAAVFDKYGRQSDVATLHCVFANEVGSFAYQGGTVTGVAGDINATMCLESPDFDGHYYLSNIKIDGTEATEEWVAELLSRVYLHQSTVGVALVEGHEAQSRRILEAIESGLQSCIVAAPPLINVTPEASFYPNDSEVTVSLQSATKDADIYYTVDDATTGILSDPIKQGEKYTGPFIVKAKDLTGGKIYIRAAATTDKKKWSSVTRKDLSFVKGQKDDAFIVNGKPYKQWNEVISAIQAAGGGTIVLKDDVTLASGECLPNVPCTITSAEDAVYKISSAPLDAENDLHFKNVIYDIGRIYANGHNIVIDEDVVTPWRWLPCSIFGGSNQKSCEGVDSMICVNGGKFDIYASGNSGSSVLGKIAIDIGGSADVSLSGAAMGATIQGDVRCTLREGARCSRFLGEQSGGIINGQLLVSLIGAPILNGTDYRGSVTKLNFGILDASAATNEVVHKFKGFEKNL